MNFKDKMAEFMMGKMTPEEKQDMMNGMMNQFFAGMTAEEKQQMMASMMEKFMGNLSD